MQALAGAWLQAGAGSPRPYLDTRMHAYAPHTSPGSSEWLHGMLERAPGLAPGSGV